MTDATKKNSEPQWQQALLASLEVGLAILDKNFNVVVWNQFLENHSGISSDKIIGTSLFKHFEEIDQEWFKIKSEPVFNLQSPAFIIWEQRPYLFKFDSSRPITSASDNMYQNVTLFPLSVNDNEVSQLGIVVYDVTDEALNKQGIQRLNKQLEQISRIDGLTGLNNRRYWEEQFANEHKRLKRTGATASVIMLDIDHFKSVNDTYGHPTGDHVIRMLAKIIKMSTRETDVSGRYGGEEFAILLPETDCNSAKLVAERIRSSAEKMKISHEGHQFHFTVSLGIAPFNMSFKDHMPWLESADKALYQAKEGGRNKVCVF